MRKCVMISLTLLSILLAKSVYADASSIANTKILGEAPAHSMGLAYQTMTHSVSLSMQNTQQAQSGLQQIGNAVTGSVIKRMIHPLKTDMSGKLYRHVRYQKPPSSDTSIRYFNRSND